MLHFEINCNIAKWRSRYSLSVASAISSLASLLILYYEIKSLLVPLGYEKTIGFCKNGGRKGKYSSLEEAIADCTNIVSCTAVNDYMCDSKGPFIRCNGKENILEQQGRLGSCLYKKDIKRTKRGKIISIHFLNVFKRGLV